MKSPILISCLLLSVAIPSFGMSRPPAKKISASSDSVPAKTLEIPADNRPFVNDPNAGGIKIDSGDNALSAETIITVIFPTEMVAAEKIDEEQAESPIVTWPDLDATFVWRTTSQGDWTVHGPRIPGQAYRLRLRDGLKDAEGKALPVSEWGMELYAAPLSVTTTYDEREHLSARPQVPLEFNYLMRLDASSNNIWFQSRATRQKYPVELLLNQASDAITGDAVDTTSPEMPTSQDFRVRPREPLPVNAQYDLVVDNVQDAYSGRNLSYPRVFPLGKTLPLAVDYVAARNWPTDKPHIEIKFTTTLGDDVLPPNALTITPAVPNLQLRKEGSLLLADGDFDIRTHYRVIVSDKIHDDRGYGMEKLSLWGATFQPKVSTILFPEGNVIRQRSRLGLRFALLQANTGPITWKLARIPLPQLPEIAELQRKASTELLIKKYALEVVAQGEIAAADQDKEILRPIEWKPEDSAVLSGPFLLEASAMGSDGKTIGNTLFVFFNEFVFTQKSSPTTVTLRLANMGDAKPVKDIRIHAIAKDGKEITSSTTDQNGVAEFAATALAGTAYYIADTSPENPAIEPATTGSSFPSGSLYQSPQPAFLGKIITDRPLYRPGQEIKIKGLLRTKAKSQLVALPAGTEIAWEIACSTQNAVIASGTAKLNANSSWDAAWKIPPQGKLGEYNVLCKINGTVAGDPANLRIEEFRNPTFSVVCEPMESKSSGEASVRISSQYFHGAPNVGSRVVWTATWTSDHDGEMLAIDNPEGFKEMDLYSENIKAPNFEMEVEGEAMLDANGNVTLTCKAPFKDPGNRAHCNVSWEAEITGPDGQTIKGGAQQEVTMNDVTLGIRANRQSCGKDIAFDLHAVPRTAAITIPEKVRAELFLIRTKSVKERLARFVYRFRNTDEFESVQKVTVAANGPLSFTPKEPGRYVLVTSPLTGQSGMPVSEEIYLSAPGEAEVSVKSEESLEVKSTQGETPFQSGQLAAFQVLSPSAGIAWVTVETDNVLDTYTMELQGNSNRIEVPVRPEYLPNASVSVYLLRPGQKDGLPGEMFGYSRMRVADAAKELKMQIVVDKPEYEPRETVHGKVTVTAGAKPVTDAELTVYAVDDSILELGGWTLPEFSNTFFPENPFSVVTYASLKGYVESFPLKNLTQKGYVVGGGGKDEFGSVKFTRQDFRPLILWLPSLKTNAEGIAGFECTAPDNLTRFRVIAIGQTADNQFGSGDVTFTVTKNLLIEPALPRFLREGDKVELRAVTRQKYSASEKLLIRCTTQEGLQLSVPGETKVTAEKDQPVVVRFPAQTAASASTSTVRFDVISESNPKHNDSVEINLPIASRNIVVQESVAGGWQGNEFKPSAQIPAAWKNSSGKYEVTLSTSQYLTKLMGIPSVLDYPHGCFEQKSSRLLVYTTLGKLLAYLPKSGERDDNYKRTIRDSLEEFNKSLLPDGQLPYWPYGTEGNPYVTIQTAWAVAEALKAGFEVPEDLAGTLPSTLQSMVLRKSKTGTTPTLRAFALFVLSQFKDESSDDLVAAAEELILHRDKLNDEGRAMLAIALHTMDQLPERQRELVRELPVKFDARNFDPFTFSSTTRTEAICTWARILITPDADPSALKKKLEVFMTSSESLSTQENLWLLIAFDALLNQNPPARLSGTIAPKADAVSPNRSASQWTDRDLATMVNFTIQNLGNPASGTYVIAAKRQLTPQEQNPVAHGLRIDRVVKNLTEPTRTGSAAAPFKIGDQLLISYRFHSDQKQSFVALTDSLPAGIEVVNPNLEMFGKFYQVPDEPGVQTPSLSYCEMRDRQTNLYFDEIATGSQGYAVLARATAAGTFSWPSTQITPMYDSRFYARTAPMECVVTSE
ncbi:MAG: alpha-2-macroglobulin family protein [Chthoniobacterales bacterium]